MGKSLTDCLKTIGGEETSITINGELYKCTKTEAVARKLFLLAQGGTEKIIDADGNTVTVVHKADPKVAKMVREFVDGKPAVQIQDKSKKNTKPGRYDSEISRRLNERLGSKAQPKRPSIEKPSVKGTQT